MYPKLTPKAPIVAGINITIFCKSTHELGLRALYGESQKFILAPGKRLKGPCLGRLLQYLVTCNRLCKAPRNHAQYFPFRYCIHGRVCVLFVVKTVPYNSSKGPVIKLERYTFIVSGSDNSLYQLAFAMTISVHIQRIGFDTKARPVIHSLQRQSVAQFSGVVGCQIDKVAALFTAKDVNNCSILAHVGGPSGFQTRSITVVHSYYAPVRSGKSTMNKVV